jgi:hypothetical protein
MANPWDNDPIVSKPKKSSNPWDNDPVVAPAPGASAAKPKTTIAQDIGQGLGNLAAGAIRGAGSIGATLMYPIDKAEDMIKGDRDANVAGLITGQQPMSRNQERRKRMDYALADAGAETDSFGYGAGKLAGEIAGTAGAGGLVGQGILRGAPVLARAGMAAPTIQQLSTAAATGGFSTGAAPGSISALANMGTRLAGGALSGGASAAMVDPSNAGTGAVVGAALPGAVKLGGVVGGAIANGMKGTANRLMQSAIKPTIKQLASGDADVAVQTMLEHGINPTKAGVAKLRELMYAKNDEIADAIAGSNATVSKQKVIAALADVRQRFGNQVSPTADLKSIQSIADDFTAHPSFPGDSIPVQAAQELKKGTYKILSKKYGQVGAADTEAQKGLARGLKEEIADAVPGIQGLNEAESRLIRTLNVAERRALMELNKNPMGLAALAGSPAGWAAFMADRSSVFKSLAARMVNSTGNQVGAAGAALGNAVPPAMLRAAAPVISAGSMRE